MTRSDSIVNLSKALLVFQSGLSSISKDSKNSFFKTADGKSYKYASLSTILEGIDNSLAAAGLVVIQPPVESGNDSQVTICTLVIHAESGEFIESRFSMTPTKKEPQGIGSCITYMRRYALASILKLNVADDDDGNEASKPNVKNESPKKKENHSSKFIDIKERMELSQSRDEVLSLVNEISAELSDEEKSLLRATFKENMQRLKKGA